MPRPLKEGMDYFPHDTDAADDEKVVALEAMFGNDGYAFYFKTLERIYRTSDAELDLSLPGALEVHAMKLRIPIPLLREMIELACGWGLFDEGVYERTQKLTSGGVQKRAEIVTDARKQRRERYDLEKARKKIGGDKPPTNGGLSLRAKGKERKGKEEESLVEKPDATNFPSNNQHPASDSLGFNSNDDGTAVIQTAFDMLAEFAADNEPNLRTDIENLHKAYPDHVVDAAMATASTLRDGKDRKWNAHAAAYLRATASNMATAAKEANSADPARRPFVLLFGTEPRIVSEASYWRDDLVKFRNAPQLFLSHKRAIMSETEWAALEAKAIAAGVWWPGARPHLEAAKQEKAEIEANPRKLGLHGRTLDEEQAARVEQLEQDTERLEKEAAND